MSPKAVEDVLLCKELLSGVFVIIKNPLQHSDLLLCEHEQVNSCATCMSTSVIVCNQRLLPFLSDVDLLCVITKITD